VRIALDDFGVGFSSLHHLRMLPIDELKLDRSLTFDVTTDQRSRSVVGAITQLAHALRLHLVVEGVEDSETMNALCELGCDDVQGYYISRPLAPELFLSWLDQRRVTRSRSS
jgi:EAL domain-containing protein (putative c-di-GMP-specific phosphodiesterase class I)